MEEEIIATYATKEEINPIINLIKNLKFDDLKKTNHLEFSVMQKDTNIDLLIKTFTNFSSIKMIQKRKHKNQNIGYDFYYLLEDGTYIVYAIAFEKNKMPLLINAFHINRDFNKFKERVIKAYKKLNI